MEDGQQPFKTSKRWAPRKQKGRKMKDEEEFKSLGSSSKCVRLLCSSDDILNHILSEVRDLKTCMTSRLTSLELKMSVLIQTCNKISNQMDAFEKAELKNVTREGNMTESLCPNDVMKSSEIQHQDEKEVSNRLKILPLSSESDYPNGSWLGDPKSVTNRVRCNIPPQNLFHINSTCFTPEKMALCLLDNLFTREELAVSNISGRSRWGKKQLNPLLIFGIKAHLKFKFFISEKGWHKICQNIDAKCRFAWKRSQRMANTNNLTKSRLKASSRRSLVKEKNSPERLSTSEEINFDFENLNHSNMDFNSCAKVMSHTSCELRILNATPAQIANLQESQEIILAEEMLPDSNDVKPIMIDNSSSDVSMNTVVMDGVVDGLGSDLTATIRHEAMDDDDDDTSATTSTSVTTTTKTITTTKGGRQSHHHHHPEETLTTIHDSHLDDEGLQLEVELGHETQEVDADG